MLITTRSAAKSIIRKLAVRTGRNINVHATTLISKAFFLERDIRNKLAYGPRAPTSAALIYVDPTKVTKAIHPNNSPRIESGMIKGGDWDKKTRDVDAIPKVLGVKQRILGGKAWEQTAAWKQCQKYLDQQTGLDGIFTADDILRRYQRLEDIILKAREMREAAFQTRREIRPDNFREAAGIMINIDRDGNLVFGMRGCHRLAIAQALQLTCIPAQLGIVHDRAVRNKLWRKNLIPVERAAAIRSAATQSRNVVPQPTKQRYTGRTTAQSIEFDANKDLHWQGKTVPKFERLIPIMPGDSLVEIGAAEGILSLTMAPHKKRVRAIDITPNRHQKALELKARWIDLGKPVENCEMILGDVLKNPEFIAGFDTLMASRVIYYFGTYLEEFMDNVRKNVDNVCFIGNPVRTEQLKQGKTGKLGEYAKYATVPGMIALVERHGFKVTHVDESLDPLIIASKT